MHFLLNVFVVVIVICVSVTCFLWVFFFLCIKCLRKTGGDRERRKRNRSHPLRGGGVLEEDHIITQRRQSRVVSERKGRERKLCADSSLFLAGVCLPPLVQFLLGRGGLFNHSSRGNFSNNSGINVAFGLTFFIFYF